MKDLQSLQGFCNKKIAELQSQLDKSKRDLEALRTAINVQAEQLSKNSATVKAHDTTLADFAKAINTNSAAINELKKG